VTKTYQRGGEKIEVLHGIDLDIAAGDFVALMGPSGSGKTTLLNLIGGLDTPTAGSIVVDGQRIDQLGSGELSRWRATHVGFVFQFYNLLPVLSAQKNVELPLLLTNLSAAQNNGWPSRGPSSPIRPSSCVTSLPAISTGSPPTRS
jgi:putative ABC transport system ATP-binding protein